MKKYILFLLIWPLFAFGQFEDYLQKDPEPTVYRQGGAAFSVVESGTGLGGFYAFPVRGFWHLGVAADFFMLRDKYQIDGYDPYYGIPFTYNKQNNVYMIDLLLTAKKRLIPNEIDDSLRPYLALGLGPIYAMNFPEDKSRPEEFRWTLAAAAAGGVDVALDGGYLFGLRLQYRIMRFTKKVGERADHSMFDIRIEIGKLLQ